MKIVGGLVAAVLLIVVGGIGWLYADAHRAREANADYVALGSSFAAGPGVAARSDDAPGLCGQSAGNYAHLLARARHLRLLDRSCGGSTTGHILRDSQLFQTPQIEDVKPTTKLVTITTGGNDLSYLGGLWSASCKLQPAALPWWLKSACKAKPGDASPAKLASLSASMDAVAKEVRRRAPHARLVFVDYTTILPDSGSCPDRLPLSPADLANARTVGHALEQVTADVARRNDAVLVRASALTRGHDVCAKDPWVFGWVFPKSFGYGPAAYHPNDKAMVAIAEALDAQLPR